MLYQFERFGLDHHNRLLVASFCYFFARSNVIRNHSVRCGASRISMWLTRSICQLNKNGLGLPLVCVVGITLILWRRLWGMRHRYSWPSICWWWIGSICQQHERVTAILCEMVIIITLRVPANSKHWLDLLLIPLADGGILHSSFVAWSHRIPGHCRSLHKNVWLRRRWMHQIWPICRNPFYLLIVVVVVLVILSSILLLVH